MKVLRDGERARLYIGDALEVMARLHKKGVRARLITSDPPFNQGEKYGEGVDDKKPWDEYVAWTQAWVFRAVRLLTPDGALVVNVPDAIVAEVKTHAIKCGLTLRRWIIWHYRFGQNTKHNFISSHTHLLYFVKDPNNFVWRGNRVLEQTVRAQMGDKRTIGKKDGSKDGMRCPLDVWHGEKGFCRIQGNNKERRKGHENQQPERILRRLILALSDKGDLVFDPFSGSGTSGTIALAHKRRFIGAELNRKNALSAWERMTKIGPKTPSDWR